jgi:hypothetical protein
MLIFKQEGVAMKEVLKSKEKIASLCTSIIVLLSVFLVAGCYEDRAEISLNADGTGTVRQKLVLPERLVVATSDDGGGGRAPAATKEKVLEQIGSALDVTSILQTEQPDGGRIIEFEGTFGSPEQFFLSEFCRDTLKLRLAPAAEGKAAIYHGMTQFGDEAPGPNITQLYGLAKGLHINRTVHLPAKIRKTNGFTAKDKRTVSWVTDLRDKQGLIKTKAFVEGPDKGMGFAVFDAAALRFSLPLKTPAPSEKGQPPEGISGLKATVSWLSVEKKLTIDTNDATPAISDLKLGIKVSWNEGRKPFACRKPMLTSLSDDLDNDLVNSAGTSTWQVAIHGSRPSKELKVEARAPAKNATKLQNLEGYVPVVTDITTGKVALQNVHELVGKDSTGNPVLDKLNFRIKSIEGTKLNIEIDGGHDTVISMDMVTADGRTVKKSGGSGWENQYSYDFREDISKVDRCELEVVVDQKVVKVPFSLKEIGLP